MQDMGKILTSGAIKRDDQKVVLNAKQNCSTLDYLKYAVSCMVPLAVAPLAGGFGGFLAADKALSNAIYGLNIISDNTNKFGGPYFEVKKFSEEEINNSSDYYEIDVGYPGDNLVTNFQLQNNEAYSLFYNYSQKISENNYTYTLNNNGIWEAQYSPKISSLNRYNTTTASSKQWWSQMVNYPLKASITIKGLVRPAMLMQYVKINTYFYGQKHVSSGIYTVTAQQDVVDGNGYRTTLGLLRLSGE